MCDKCSRLAPGENDFVDRHIPRLRAGARFDRRGWASNTTGSLQLTRDLNDLVFTEINGGAGGRGVTLPISQLSEAKRTARESAVLLLVMHSRKEHRFVAAKESEARAWVEALRFAQHRSTKLRGAVSPDTRALPCHQRGHSVQPGAEAIPTGGVRAEEEKSSGHSAFSFESKNASHCGSQHLLAFSHPKLPYLRRRTLNLEKLDRTAIGKSGMTWQKSE